MDTNIKYLNDKTCDEIIKLLTSKNSIVIIGGNLPLYLSEGSFSGKMSGRFKSYSDKKAEDLIKNSL